MPDPYRLKSTLLGETFEGEGSEAAVRADFKEWRDTVLAVKSRTRAAEKEPDGGADASEMKKPIVAEEWFTLFSDEGKFVSLNKLPKTDQPVADALVLLILGMTVGRGETFVYPVTLMKASDKSGLKVERIDRALSARMNYVHTAGTRRGKKYSLNNPGLEYAKKVAMDLMTN